MKAFVIVLLLSTCFTISAQIDRSQLIGDWCVIEVLDLWSIEVDITQEDIDDVNFDFVNSRFYINAESYLIFIEEGSGLDESIDGAMIIGANIKPNVFLIEDNASNSDLKFEVIKVSSNELIFKLYDEELSLTFSCRKC